MTAKFGLLAKLTFLHDCASMLIAGINPSVTHNFEKYHALKKVHYLSAIEEVPGDYLEFGVFTGSSFCHSIRCCRAMARLNAKVLDTRFFGFDSFQGFGTLEDEDRHPFYTDANFVTNLDTVSQRVAKISKGITYELIPGFFAESLRDGPQKYGIAKARIIFVDSDTYGSSSEALKFCLPTLQEGTFVVLDDYFSYRASTERGVAKAFSEFLEQGKLQVRQVFGYGMGGVVFVVSAIGT